MPTHKVHSKYAATGNDVLQTNRISLKAKGLLGYLISKPEGWDFSSVRIANEIKESTKTIQTILRELELDGLLIREKLLNGRVLYHVYSSYELLKEPMVDNDSESKLLRAKMGDISKPFLIEKKRERESLSDASLSSLRSLVFGGEGEHDLELLSSLATEFEVKPAAAQYVAKKYFLSCDDKSKKPTGAGLRLWLTREKWNFDDYSTKKKNLLRREAVMQGEW